MKLLLKILFFLFTIFYVNISEAKIFVVVEVISETTSSFTFDEGKNNDEFRNVISENDFVITCENESNLVDYRNWAVSVGARAAKEGGTFYRAMGNAEFAALESSGGLSHMAGKELFVSSSANYSRAYLQKSGYDVLVQFNMKPGAMNFSGNCGKATIIYWGNLPMPKAF